MKKKEKEEFMTNILTNIKDIMETEAIDSKNNTPKLAIILDFLRLKSIANKSKEEIYKYTERNKEIRQGQRVLVGTRITTKELLLIMAENDQRKNIFEYISKQYPSIDSKEKMFYGALYQIKKTNTILFILKVLLGNQ